MPVAGVRWLDMPVLDWMPLWLDMPELDVLPGRFEPLGCALMFTSVEDDELLPLIPVELLPGRLEPLGWALIFTSVDEELVPSDPLTLPDGAPAMLWPGIAPDCPDTELEPTLEVPSESLALPALLILDPAGRTPAFASMLVLVRSAS